MPKRTDLKKIMIIGSGPIVIGQACEFDYSGTQACRALKQEGYEIVLVNSNPATIMTDPELADRTYVEPLTVEAATAIIERERPDALLPTVGGQTALNLTVKLAESGVLKQYGVELIGAKLDAIKVGEDRLLFKQAMDEIGLQMPKARFCHNMQEAMGAAEAMGFDPAREDPASLLALKISFCAVPNLFFLLSVACIWRYPLDSARLAEIRAALRVRESRRLATMPAQGS